jgi:hypothetical protein
MCHEGEPIWRTDIDALAFRPDRHEGHCVIHRLAFRTILGFYPAPEDCMRLFRTKAFAFHAAAQKKIASHGLQRDANFHLTSRDVLGATD